jgi:signal transduction histidine kinase
MFDGVAGWRRFVVLGGAIALFALLVGWSVDVVRDARTSEHIARLQADKRAIALQGALELERAVQAFKDCILRGDRIYSADFYKHLEAVEQAAAAYQAAGPLEGQEEHALRSLLEAIPHYRAAIYTVTQMRERNASISEIDAAVMGGDRPISAAFAQLESIDGDPAPPSALQSLGVRPELLFAGLGGVLLIFTLGSKSRAWQLAGVHENSLRVLSNRAIRWEEEKGSRAFAQLHDGVCQSLSAIMYMLTRSSRTGESTSRAQLQALPEPVIPSLQAAIRETLSIARDLRPPTVGYSGLLESLDSIWFDSRRQVTGIDIDARTSLVECDVPEELKPTILRLAQMCLEWCAQSRGECRVTWDLRRRGDELRLSIRVLGTAPENATLGEAYGVLCLPEAIRARVILAGGCCAGLRKGPGGKEITATWPAALSQ